MEPKELESRKLFVGGLPRWGITSKDLRSHFARYGLVVDALVIFMPGGEGRGFGFVEFQDEESALRALDERERDNHNDFFGCRVDVKKAEKKQEARSVQTQSATYQRGADSKKIFVGGLRDKITEDDLSDYFGKFGTITDVVVMYDKETKKGRGFGFVTFDSQEAKDKVLENSFHCLKGTKVETKNAQPRDKDGRYHGSMIRGGIDYWNSFGEMYSPLHVPFVPYYNGPYMVPYPYPYAPPGIINYGYLMNQTGSSNDTGMMAMQAPPAMYAHYRRPFGYDAKLGIGSKFKKNPQRIDISYGYDTASLKLESDSDSDSKIKVNEQGNDISAFAGMKSDPLEKPESDSDSKMKGNEERIDISASAGMKSDPVKPDSNSL